MIKTTLRIAGFLPLLALSISACQPLPRLPAAQAASAASAKTSAQEASKAVVQRFYDEVVNKQNLEAMKDVMAPNFVPHELGLKLADAAEMFAGMPDQKATVSLWVVEGDLVTAVVTVRGTHTGTFLGVAPTGKPVNVSLIDIWRVKDGKIVEVWHNFPTSDILAQISPLPAK